ncbi:hypothetical protein ACIQZO_06210 [Streptomyces sp. NPDC097617]|uniref:hypothetical protein n=1 Tax=Streptomyces sp. NPDC097617 TaxID=3366091 RepID=UPI0037F34A74
MRVTTTTASELVIEDKATYYLLRIVQEPGKPDAIGEDILSGFQVRAAITAALADGSSEVEQKGPTEITTRQADGSCTYSKVC